LRICRFGFTQTPVGGFANCPEGIPVPRADAAPDHEVVSVADDQLGPDWLSVPPSPGVAM